MEERSQRSQRGQEGKDAKNLEFGECRNLVCPMILCSNLTSHNHDYHGSRKMPRSSNES